MKEPLEFAYYQLINGKMYPTKISQNKLQANAMPLIEGVSNSNTEGQIEPQKVSKSDTVTPKFSIEEIED